jgi:hypothetical protein
MRYLVSTFLILSLPLLAVAQHAPEFDKDVRPILQAKCFACHGEKEQKAHLDLRTTAAILRGGDGGPAISPGTPDKSLLFVKIVADKPPHEKLADAEICKIRAWIDAGAKGGVASQVARQELPTIAEGRRFWAFQPPVRPQVPANGQKNPIDAFIFEKLQAKGLSFAPEADRRTLIRRVTFDLTGLPPTPAEVEAFVRDQTPEAWKKLVDRLLASPHYGERWGRHWLDLVRYADTAGENSDHPLPHAWRYRNWVIDAFNRDMPYDEFLREQIAGDILAAKGPPEQYASRIIATGYLALARRFEHDSDMHMYLTHEDGIDTLGKAFLGLTLGCARCHDHKYDPISARDYYALYGIFDSTKFAFPGCEAKQQPRDLVPLLPPAEWDRVVKPYQEKLARFDAEIQSMSNAQLNQARDVQAAFVTSRHVLSQGEIQDGGNKTFDSGSAAIEVKAGEMVLLSVLPLKSHGADSTLVEFELSEVDGQKRRWNATNDLVGDLLAGNPHADRLGNAGVWWFFDLRNQPTLLLESVRGAAGKAGINVWRNGDTPSVFVNSTGSEITAWTRLSARSLFAHPSENGNVGIGWLSPINGKLTIRGRIKDAHPGGPDGVGWVLEHFAADVRKSLLAQADSATKLRSLTKARAELVKAAPKQDVAFAVIEGKSADARLQLRGDPEKLGEVVPRRWLEVLGGAPIINQATSGRLDLAHWIASAGNPLTARVIANRIWLHHFGKGLVKTPNDFGTRGLPPTHPELLDWLASEFVRTGWSIKVMHRLLLLSKTYQQSSAARDDAMKADPTNELYWRFERRRLSAEELRDSLLVASGQLDRKPGEAYPIPPESSWGFTQHVPFSTFFETNKRSVYLIQIRNRRHPFLGLFDGADPNATTPQRQNTTVPTQALYFMNDPFFHAQAEKLAERIINRPEAERANELFRIALQRKATDGERAFVSRFIQSYRETLKNQPEAQAAQAAWSALARVLLASNEFLFVE